jgi:hypothetical protein
LTLPSTPLTSHFIVAPASSNASVWPAGTRTAP